MTDDYWKRGAAEPTTEAGKRLALDMWERSDDHGFGYPEACERVREVERAVVLLTLDEQKALYGG